jgi:F420-dependent methylenetetrahydromethanopterin dehydrogenase
MTDLKARLQRLALCAEVANYWTDDMRLMSATGVADTVYEAVEHIEQLEARLTEIEHGRAPETD